MAVGTPRSSRALHPTRSCRSGKREHHRGVPVASPTPPENSPSSAVFNGSTGRFVGSFAGNDLVVGRTVSKSDWNEGVQGAVQYVDPRARRPKTAEHGERGKPDGERRSPRRVPVAGVRPRSSCCSSVRSHSRRPQWRRAGEGRAECPRGRCRYRRGEELAELRSRRQARLPRLVSASLHASAREG